MKTAKAEEHTMTKTVMTRFDINDYTPAQLDAIAQLDAMYEQVRNDLIDKLNREQLDYEHTIECFIIAGANTRATAER